MPEPGRHAPILWYTGRPGDALLARHLQRTLDRLVIVTAGPDELLSNLRLPERPLALVVGEPEDGSVPGGILRAVKPAAGPVPIVYVGGEEPAEELAARRTGVHYVAQRPVNLDELNAVVAALADRSQRTDRAAGPC
jgi:hypothetical protein